MDTHIDCYSLARWLAYSEVVIRTAPPLLQALKSIEQPETRQLHAIEILEELISNAYELKNMVASAKTAAQ